MDVSDHKFALKDSQVKRTCAAGTRIMATEKVLAGLNLMSLALITLEKNGIREPHWHPNASELTYCAKGKALVTIFSPGNQRDTFILNEGEVMFIPRGYLHYIENIHSGSCQFILAFNNGNPEDLDLSESVGSMSAHVLAATFNAKEESFKLLKTTCRDVFISERKAALHLPEIKTATSYKFDLEHIEPQIDTEGGLARIVNSDNFPILKNLALFSLRMNKGSVREPHWHPNAMELNYVVAGKARLTIFSPGGNKDTFTLDVGEGSVIPAGYFHHIENIGTEELHMTVFFNNEKPDDIGLSGAFSSYSSETLSSLFALDEEFFKNLPHFQKDRMIVPGGGILQ